MTNRSNYKSNNTVQFSVLSHNQCADIFSAALEILERTGSKVYSSEALAMLKSAGCKVEGEHVRIPSYLIKKALNTAPSRIVLCDRNGNRRIFLEGCNSYYGPGPTNPYFYDLETGERRKVVKSDVVNVAKVCDALPNIDFVMSLAGITDCPPELADVHEVHAMLQNTSKTIVGWSTGINNLKIIIEMFAAVAGDLNELQKKPSLALYAGDPVTPLIHPEDALEKLLYMAELGLPVIYPPGLQMGGNSPITIAGTLALGIADNLVGLLLTQLKNEGAPFIGGCIPGIMDMQTTSCIYCAPEGILAHAAAAEMFRYLNIPMWSTAGVTDSKILDEQSAIESAIMCYTTALAGANLIHDVGFIESGMAASLEQVVMGDEIIGMVRKIIAGVEVNEETLALDVIDEVGPGGHFLGTQHTFKNFKEKIWFPTLIDRQRYSQWESQGKKTMGQRIKEKAQRIIRDYKPEPLVQDVKHKLDLLVEKAEQDHRERKSK